MAERARRVRPDCIYVNNPYHECNDYCMRKTAESKKQMSKKKSDNDGGMKENKSNKNIVQGKGPHPACSKASNPFHQCNESCFKTITQARAQGDKRESGSFVLDISRSFGKKKGSQPKAPKELNSERTSRTVASDPAKHASTPPKTKTESRNGNYVSHSLSHYEEIGTKNRSLNKDELEPSSLEPPTSQSIEKPDHPEDTPNKKEDDENLWEGTVRDQAPNIINMGNNIGLNAGFSFSFSGISQLSMEDNGDREEDESVTSESCISVGKYRVKASFSSILQSILDKYGDIAATCKLESVAMRSYYLECVCYVLQELQSSQGSKHLTKSKVKELSAILKDVEASEINVKWLRRIIEEISEAIEAIDQNKAVEVEKANCESEIELVKKELQNRVEDLELKEKEVLDAKERVDQTNARLSELELKSARLNEIMVSIRSKADAFSYKSLFDKA